MHPRCQGPCSLIARKNRRKRKVPVQLHRFSLPQKLEEKQYSVRARHQLPHLQAPKRRCQRLQRLQRRLSLIRSKPCRVSDPMAELPRQQRKDLGRGLIIEDSNQRKLFSVFCQSLLRAGGILNFALRQSDEPIIFYTL